MNPLVGKIFEDRKNSERKVIIKDYQVSANDIEVVTIEFLGGCGKKAGTTENKFLKYFKKSWKETEEVIDDDITDEVIEKDVDETEKAEEVVDTEENLSDEDYAKIGVEIAEQAKQKTKKKRNYKKVEFVGEKPTDEEIISALNMSNISYKKYDNKSYFVILDETGKATARVFIQNKKMRIQTKTLNEFASKLSDVITGYNHTLSNVIFIEYTDTCIDTMIKVIE